MSSTMPKLFLVLLVAFRFSFSREKNVQNLKLLPKLLSQSLDPETHVQFEVSQFYGNCTVNCATMKFFGSAGKPPRSLESRCFVFEEFGILVKLILML